MPTPTVRLSTVTLPGDLAWVDEFDWTPVMQAQSYALDGALIVEQAARQAGRPITLQGAENRAWVTRQTLEALYALAQTPSTGLALTLADARTFTVLFRHDQMPIEARPITDVSPPAAEDYYWITVRLMTV